MNQFISLIISLLPYFFLASHHHACIDIRFSSFCPLISLFVPNKSQTDHRQTTHLFFIHRYIDTRTQEDTPHRRSFAEKLRKDLWELFSLLFLFTKTFHFIVSSIEPLALWEQFLLLFSFSLSFLSLITHSHPPHYNAYYCQLYYILNFSFRLSYFFGFVSASFRAWDMFKFELRFPLVLRRMSYHRTQIWHTQVSQFRYPCCCLTLEEEKFYFHHRNMKKHLFLW